MSEEKVTNMISLKLKIEKYEEIKQALKGLNSLTERENVKLYTKAIRIQAGERTIDGDKYIDHIKKHMSSMTDQIIDGVKASLEDALKKALEDLHEETKSVLFLQMEELAGFKNE